MGEIKIGETVFSVDYEKIQEYYRTHSLCDCGYCRNLYGQIKEAAQKLTELLAAFGVDASRPDECNSVQMEDCIDYLFVGYTATGKKETTERFEMETDGLKVTIASGDDYREWFPDEQKEPYFFITVLGLMLPWALEEPFSRNDSFMDKLKKAIKKHRTKTE